MPYRRLPNTDQARLRTLKTAVDNCVQGGIYTNVLKHNTYFTAKNILEKFSREVEAYKKCVSEQSSKRGNAKYEAAFKSARMYVTHFLQVLSMSVMRGEIARAKRAYYGLNPDDDSLPTITLESAVLEWSEKISQGERKRQQLGRNTADALGRVAAMREECDSAILTVWQEIEEKFAALESGERIAKCAQYGIIYYTRPDRKKKAVIANE